MQVINTDKLESFLELLKEGFGLSKAAKAIGYDAKVVTEALEEDETLLQQAHEAVHEGYKERLEEIKRIKGRKNPDAKALQMAKEDLKTAIPNLILWESNATKEEILNTDASKIVASSYICSTFSELATSCGFFDQELAEYLLQRDHLKFILTKYG
jgi:hypothetical protein